MTIKELIEELKKYPETAQVHFMDNSFSGSTEEVSRVTYYKNGKLFVRPNTVVLESKS